MNEREAIEKLGGPSAVARRYGYKQSQVSNWIVRGIPARVIADDHRLTRALRQAGYKRGGE